MSVVYYGQTNQIENKINDTTFYCDAIYRSIQLNYILLFLNQGRNQLWLYASNKIICGRNDGLWRTSVLCILLYRQID